MKFFKLLLVTVLTLVLVLFLITGSPRETISQQGTSVCNPDICQLTGSRKECANGAKIEEGTLSGNCLSVERTVEMVPSPNDPNHYDNVECTSFKFYNCTYGQSSGGFNLPGCGG